MSTTFRSDLLVPNTCADAPPQRFREACHDKLYKDIKGNVIKCDSENEMISPKTLINRSLLKRQHCALSDSKNHNLGDTFLPLSDTRKDMAAYCYLYHVNGGCN